MNKKKTQYVLNLRMKPMKGEPPRGDLLFGIFPTRKGAIGCIKKSRMAKTKRFRYWSIHEVLQDEDVTGGNVEFYNKNGDKIKAPKNDGNER